MAHTRLVAGSWHGILSRCSMGADKLATGLHAAARLAVLAAHYRMHLSFWLMGLAVIL